MAHNVLAVKDVLPARISKLRSSLQSRQNVAEQKRAEGVSSNTVLWSLAADRRRTFTALLSAVCPYTIILKSYL